MKIKYKFQNGDISEIEVDDEMGLEISKINRRDKNVDRKETRRHIYLSDIVAENLEYPNESDILDVIIENEEKQEFHKRLAAAIETLDPRQKDLIIRIFWRSEKRRDIAKTYGISERSVGRLLQNVLGILYNLLK